MGDVCEYGMEKRKLLKNNHHLRTANFLYFRDSFLLLALLFVRINLAF